MTLLIELGTILFETLSNIVPIAAVIIGFQWWVIRRPIPNQRRLVIGFLYVLLGLSLFLLGLQRALFPLGKLMAEQLTDPAFIYGAGSALQAAHWADYYWVYLFAISLGFSAALAEPTLMAVALKANEVSGGTIGVWGLRIAIAIGAGLGVSVGALRIVTGAPIYLLVIALYAIIAVQTYFTPKLIVPLAYDSGYVTASTVMVPLVTALGLGLAEAVPGRSALLDGFGLIIFACLFPTITVMAYAQLADYRARRAARLRGITPLPPSTPHSSRGEPGCTLS